jgi:hypothetical protein
MRCTRRAASIAATCAGALCALALWSGPARAADPKDPATRAGSCAEAKSQMAFFCDPNSTDMMSGLTACTNAKKNVKSACEGVVEADQAYKFDKK